MGQELGCRMRYRKKTLAGKAYLETDHILFRGDERLKIPLKDATRVRAAAGILHLEFAGDPVQLELGAAAEKWAAKILHPPSRADKLGIKPGLRVRLVGDFAPDFTRELSITEPAGKDADLIFLHAASRQDLARVAKLIRALNPAGALWVVYPKGVEAIRETEVIESGRSAGLKDVKVCAFCPTHTALKFVIPLAARR
jgi:hypothetical protein